MATVGYWAGEDTRDTYTEAVRARVRTATNLGYECLEYVRARSPGDGWSVLLRLYVYTAVGYRCCRFVTCVRTLGWAERWKHRCV